MAAARSRRPPTTTRSRRPSAATLARRWLVVGLAVLIGYAYYHPLRSWIETRHELHSAREQVAQLAAQKLELQRRVQAAASLDSLARQARRLGYIRPGEHLFIVKGIEAWRKAQSKIERGGK